MYVCVGPKVNYDDTILNLTYLQLVLQELVQEGAGLLYLACLERPFLSSLQDSKQQRNTQPT